ncbi:hypothetical protein [Roseateles chitinivorans]|uniref:hypothetical protein n=1 Tax=Roseateles chitinivorans TaxID=2917965 RepID=UPI003D66BAE1
MAAPPLAWTDDVRARLGEDFGLHPVPGFDVPLPSAEFRAMADGLLNAVLDASPWQLCRAYSILVDAELANGVPPADIGERASRAFRALCKETANFLVAHGDLRIVHRTARGRAMAELMAEALRSGGRNRLLTMNLALLTHARDVASPGTARERAGLWFACLETLKALSAQGVVGTLALVADQPAPGSPVAAWRKLPDGRFSARLADVAMLTEGLRFDPVRRVVVDVNADMSAASGDIGDMGPPARPSTNHVAMEALVAGRLALQVRDGPLLPRSRIDLPASALAGWILQRLSVEHASTHTIGPALEAFLHEHFPAVLGGTRPTPAPAAATATTSATALTPADFLLFHHALRTLIATLVPGRRGGADPDIAGLLGAESGLLLAARPGAVQAWSSTDTLGLLSFALASSGDRVTASAQATLLVARITMEAMRAARQGLPFHIDVDLARRLTSGDGAGDTGPGAHFLRLLPALESLSGRGILGPLVAVSRRPGDVAQGWRRAGEAWSTDRVAVRDLLDRGQVAALRPAQLATMESPMPGWAVLRLMFPSPDVSPPVIQLLPASGQILGPGQALPASKTTAPGARRSSATSCACLPAVPRRRI